MAKKRNRKQVTITIEPEEVLQLEQLADLYGCKWGGIPSISRLMSAIAKGDLILFRKVKDTP